MGKSHAQKKEAQQEKQALRDEQRKAAQKENTLRQMKKYIIYAVSLLILIAIIITLVRNAANNAVSTADLPELKLTTVAETDNVIGANPEIVIVEYSDFQCPACKSAEPMVKQLLEKYGDNITFVYRDFPLKSIHPKATIAAQAAHAAGMQGKYWEMHELLFENQNEWVNSNEKERFYEYAEQIGLDVTQFKLDLVSDDAKALVANSYNHGLEIGVQSTPSFFLNGKKVTIQTGIADFDRRIEPLLR